jgi:hypothetical protein
MPLLVVSAQVLISARGKTAVELNLRTRQIECYDYAHTPNPPVLHRKESFLLPQHHLHAKFARLTQQEEKAGLLADSAAIGTRAGWLARLQAHGVTLRGHRLVKALATSAKE